jgi:DNA-binding PucR family transcriptional regulator
MDPTPSEPVAAEAQPVSWAELLDEMDRRVALVHQALAERRVPPVLRALPRVAGALPLALAERARGALASTEVCEDATKRRLVAVSTTLDAVRASSGRFADGPQSPAFVDKRL